MNKPRYRAHSDGTFSLIEGPPPTVTVDSLTPYAYSGQQVNSPWEQSIWDGGKFAGGFGPTQLQQVDYWTLRHRSAQLFTENLYARGLIRRLLTNEINTGLMPEATPQEGIIGLPDDSLSDWTEDVEGRFTVWGSNPQVCDWLKQSTFPALQRAARAEALISGDVLAVLRYPADLRLPPSVQLVSGNAVATPLGTDQANIRKGHTVKHGVEMDARGRQVAYWIRQADGAFKRLPAFGEKSGRRIAWLVYGTDKRHDDVRGQPLLSLVMQSLKEIDRYRDSVQRKALVNSFIATYIKKTENKIGTLPMTGGAVRRGSATINDADGATRQFNVSSQIPGMVFEELQQGEEPVAFNNSVANEKFGEFEASVIHAIAWANEVPPEILQQAFSNNYSASQAAINEFRIYLNLVWSRFGDEFCKPVYVAWLLNQAQQRRIVAPSLLEAWRDPLQYDVFGAWVSAEWYGSIKPSTDMGKQVKASAAMIENGFSTHAREARILAGTKYSQNIKRISKENEQKVAAMRPLLELQTAQVQQGAASAMAELQETTGQILELVDR